MSSDILIFCISNITFLFFTLYFIFIFIAQFVKNNIKKLVSIFTVLLLSLGLILGNGTSAGISEISLFLPFAFILGGLLSIPDPARLVKITLSCGCLILIFALSDRKFKEPYAWWFTSEPGIYHNSTTPRLPILLNLKLSSISALTIEEISNAIITNSSRSDDVFFFPNISGLYAITDRFPHSKAVVTWFDFLPDDLANYEAKRIQEHPPKVIVNLELPQNAWNVHEALFRNGKKLGQRKILEAINSLTAENNSSYELIYSKKLNPESVIYVWVKR
jgi:hypothetical protein